MHPFAAFLKSKELWLMRRVRDYALERDYTRYTSTLEEAWRISIIGLSDSISSALDISDEPWELGPDDTFVSDPMAAFGMLEAQRHRSRGVTLAMFMGLMKYYRQAYLDLVRISFDSQRIEVDPLLREIWDGARLHRFVERVFDRIEIAFCSEWSRWETVHTAIDELQATNRLMTNEKNKFLTIFESLPTAVFLLDDNCRIVHMNHSAAQMIDPGAASGWHYYSSPEERMLFPWLADELSRFKNDGFDSEREYPVELPDGNARQVLARFRPMQDISFKYPGTLVILKDISESKKTEEELSQVRAHLIEQDKMASIGQLAAGVAHEINNPMGFISSNLTSLGKYLDRLLEFIAFADHSASKCSEGADELRQARGRLKIDYIARDAKDLIDESLDGADRVRRIVQDLKTFSRVDQAECTLVNLNETLETTINIAWNEIKYVSTLERDFGSIPPIKCYPQQLNQVFLNLLVNSAQASGGGGTITVRTWSDDKNVFVSVSDTGTGIRADVLPRIFEPFFTTKEVGKGTGLGLSISYGIIKNHGGEINVQSEDGKGSTFTVSLPHDTLCRETLELVEVEKVEDVPIA